MSEPDPVLDAAITAMTVVKNEANEAGFTWTVEQGAERFLEVLRSYRILVHADKGECYEGDRLSRLPESVTYSGDGWEHTVTNHLATITHGWTPGAAAMPPPALLVDVDRLARAFYTTILNTPGGLARWEDLKWRQKQHIKHGMEVLIAEYERLGGTEPAAVVDHLAPVTHVEAEDWLRTAPKEPNR